MALVPKVRRLAKSALSSIDTHIVRVEDKEVEKTIALIANYLREHPDEAKRCWIGCQAGYFCKREPGEVVVPPIPASRTHFNLVSYKLFIDVLCQCCSTFTQRDLTRLVKESSKDQISMLLCFGLALPMAEPMWTHDSKEFIHNCFLRHHILGNRLEQLEMDEKGQANWQKACYRFNAEEGKLMILHVSGHQVVHSVLHY